MYYNFKKKIGNVEEFECRRGWTGQLKEKFMEERGGERERRGSEEVGRGARRWEGELILYYNLRKKIGNLEEMGVFFII